MRQSVDLWMTLGNKFLDYFPLGNDLILSVKVDLHRFKLAPPNIVYQPFLDIHKDKIKKRITQYNKFDTKVPIFAILKDPKNPIRFYHESQRSGRIFRTISF